jgi:pyruvate dehydrogenase E2 component (dihydrolipoamide acetyltransferase)
MATKILLPKFGQTVETSEVVQWLVKEGDAIKKGAILCEIATDKSSLEVESQYEGTLLKILLPPATTVPVGCVMAVIGAPGEKLTDAFLAECLATHKVAADAATAPAASVAMAPPLPPAPPKPIAKPTPGPTPAKAALAPAPASSPRQGRVFISPRARILAVAQEVPVAVLTGSGENGRITEADVQGYLAALGPVSPAARAAACKRDLDLRGLIGSGPNGRIMVEDLARIAQSTGAPAKKIEALEPAAPLVAKLERFTPMRRAVAASMTLSAQTIPAFQLEVSVEAAALIARREAEKAAGVKVSFGDIIAKAVALAIRRHPKMAATWTDAGLQYLDRIHIGFAVSVPNGLVTPVVTDADLRSVSDIAGLAAGLVEKARAGKLAQEEYTGAVLTLSNLGAFPVDRFVAIVPPGQSGIIAIGRIRDEMVVKNGGFFPAKIMSLTLSADHRYIDGTGGAAFMKDVKEILENADRI